MLSGRSPLAGRLPHSERLPWFATRDLGAGYHLIAEPGHVNSFLVTGERLALLFDTGMGMSPLRPVVRSITDLPLLVVNSHHHYDHRGGNAEFADHAVDVAVHVDGLDLHDAAPPEFLGRYRTVAADTERDFAAYEQLDRQRFFLLSDAMRVRPTPDLTAWSIPAVAPTHALIDGDRLDLGGRELQVLHTPGHSPDSLCLWDEDTGTVLAGDTVLAAASWAHSAEGDVAVFADSLARLAKLTVRRALVAHNLRAELPGSFVTRAAANMAAVRDGRTTPYPATDLFGNAVCRHDFDDVAIFTRPEASTE
ncbi:MAG: Zn-dependent hydrolase, glyoxylase [Pseudonocardiales bacterium]|nr:Zn-dependent hydrolase, glyoxylase [Pseudonocardiales bacterium]